MQLIYMAKGLINRMGKISIIYKIGIFTTNNNSLQSIIWAKQDLLMGGNGFQQRIRCQWIVSIHLSISQNYKIQSILETQFQIKVKAQIILSLVFKIEKIYMSKINYNLIQNYNLKEFQ